MHPSSPHMTDEPYARECCDERAPEVSQAVPTAKPLGEEDAGSEGENQRDPILAGLPEISREDVHGAGTTDGGRASRAVQVGTNVVFGTEQRCFICWAGPGVHCQILVCSVLELHGACCMAHPAPQALSRCAS
jgi:hypothetical protein